MSVLRTLAGCWLAVDGTCMRLKPDCRATEKTETSSPGPPCTACCQGQTSGRCAPPPPPARVARRAPHVACRAAPCAALRVRTRRLWVQNVNLVAGTLRLPHRMLQAVGPTRFSTQGAERLSMALDGDDVPWVAYLAKPVPSRAAGGRGCSALRALQGGEVGAPVWWWKAALAWRTTAKQRPVVRQESNALQKPDGAGQWQLRAAPRAAGCRD